jgi:ParB-like chromosome segregation protein Spo0J
MSECVNMPIKKLKIRVRFPRYVEIPDRPETWEDLMQSTQTADPGLTDSIRALGVIMPLFVSPDGRVFSGRARALSAREVGLKEVPVVVING